MVNYGISNCFHNGRVYYITLHRAHLPFIMDEALAYTGRKTKNWQIDGRYNCKAKSQSNFVCYIKMSTG